MWCTFETFVKPRDLKPSVRLLADHGSYVRSPKSTPRKLLPPSLGIMLTAIPGAGISSVSAPVWYVSSCAPASLTYRLIAPPTPVPVRLLIHMPSKYCRLEVEPRNESVGCCNMVLPPTSRPPPVRPAPVDVTPGIRTPAAWMLCAVGSASMTSRVITICFDTAWMSTSGVAPETVMVSSTAPTFNSAFTFAVKSVVSSMPSRFTELKPGRTNVTV